MENVHRYHKRLVQRLLDAYAQPSRPGFGSRVLDRGCEAASDLESKFPEAGSLHTPCLQLAYYAYLMNAKYTQSSYEPLESLVRSSLERGQPGGLKRALKHQCAAYRLRWRRGVDQLFNSLRECERALASVDEALLKMGTEFKEAYSAHETAKKRSLSAIEQARQNTGVEEEQGVCEVIARVRALDPRDEDNNTWEEITADGDRWRSWVEQIGEHLDQLPQTVDSLLKAIDLIDERIEEANTFQS